MIANSNVVIQGGTFSNVPKLGGTTNGLDILQRNIVAGATHDSGEEADPPKCHPNTRTAVIQEIMGWVEDDDSKTQFLWLEGPAGAGKTAIAHTVATLCQEQGRLAAGFFFSRTAAGRNDFKCLIATIAYQLIQSIPEVRTFIEAAVVQDPTIFTKNLTAQIRHLIIQPLKKTFKDNCPPSTPNFILIDGLDECLPERSQRTILEAMDAEFRQGPLAFRIMIASRAEPDIQDVFDMELVARTTHITLDDKYKPDIDIGIYLRSNFADILRKHRRNRGMASLSLPWPSENDLKTIISRSSGQFIYPTTVIKYIDVRHQRPDERLKVVLSLSGSGVDSQEEAENPFAILDALYHEIFRTVVDISSTKRVLGAILVLKTSLTVDVLESLLKLQPGDAEVALCNLHSLLHVPNALDSSNPSRNHIHLHHASLGDFLFDLRRAGVYHIDIGSAHATLTECCLRAMSLKPIYFLGESLGDGLAAQRYVWENWTHHFLNMTTWSDSVMSAFKVTSPTVFLSWIKHGMRPGPDSPVDRYWTLEKFMAVKSRFTSQAEDGHQGALDLSTQCSTIFEIYFQNAWANLMKAAQPESRDASLTFGILAVVLKRTPISFTTLAALLALDWKEFSRVTLQMDSYIRFGNREVTPCEALSEFISGSGRPEFNTNMPEVHTYLVIRFIECVASYSLLERGSAWYWNKIEAYNYALANWHDYINLANGIQLLDYIYDMNLAAGHEPTCPHTNNDECPIMCQVEKTTRCIEWRSIYGEFFPHTQSEADMRLLKMLREIIDMKYLDTPAYSWLNHQIQQWSRDYKSAISKAQGSRLELEDRTSQLEGGSCACSICLRGLWRYRCCWKN